MIIGIGGCSQSGKSSLAQKLYHHLQDQGYGLRILSIDDFVKAPEAIPLVRGHIDWEVPESIDFKKYEAAISKAAQQYQMVICEGFLIYNEPMIYRHFDKCVFLEVAKTTYLERRKKDLRWGLMPDWYLEYVWDCYLKYGKVEHLEQVLVLSGEVRIEIKKVINFLKL